MRKRVGFSAVGFSATERALLHIRDGFVENHGLAPYLRLINQNLQPNYMSTIARSIFLYDLLNPDRDEVFRLAGFPIVRRYIDATLHHKVLQSPRERP